MKDITRRHILLATDAGLRLLGLARTWWCDGTFKITREPFKQLYTIHVFVRGTTGEDSLKSIPVAYCYMSAKRKKDYRDLLKKLKAMYLDRFPDKSVFTPERIISDFEVAFWRACRLEYSDVNPKTNKPLAMKGCNFHWGQAIDRKVSELGFSKKEREDEGTKLLVNKVLALPMLPATRISDVFNGLQLFSGTEKLAKLCDYVAHQWMGGNYFCPEDSVVRLQPPNQDKQRQGGLAPQNKSAMWR